ncbi:TetR/AcrR family transcriptional regulator [Streptomyces sp. P9(2023)]|uniref:TetR/AcrR family transcriptional regulator n=1 Tax=Streptomyces sp. P9(2023) TaxID=3064394 RepID=UPI0028F4021B|nr:TetR/AcrR family transcriptional regulator [Streptomyces sp. P9(2023)]MDT9686886.1 TetR/AcrR family transcriptional regulator [Streptomyces sp. P9(2023)]
MDEEDTGTASGPDAGLRGRLIDAGVELVHAEGAQALSLREIARRAGVSHGAPRRYFPTHLDLLSAIARAGFAELAERVAAAMGEEAEDREGARAQLDALARVHLDFARTRRGMYELMFRHDLLESGRLGLRETSLPLFDLLGRLVARARQEAGPEPAVVAAALWANLHGIAQLRAWGSLRLATRTDDVEPLLRAVLDAHLGPTGRAR